MSDPTDFNDQLGALMGKLQEAQGKMKDIEAKAVTQTGRGEAGGGMVKAVANGRLEVLSISIDPEAVDPADVEMLEDLVLSAVNQALQAARDSMAKEVAGGLGLPFGLG